MLIEVLDAVIGDKQKGERLEVGDDQGKYLIALGYAKSVEAEAKKVVAEEKKAPAKRANKK